MSFSGLPVELYRSIAEYLGSRNDVYCLMKTNRAFYEELEGIYYQELILRNSDLPNIEYILERLTTRPRRACFVLTSEILLTGDIGIAKWATVSLILRQLTNLRHLVLKPSLCDLRSLLDGCSFQLESFDFGGEAKLYLPIFLASQPKIRHLLVQYYRTTDPLPPTTLPHLRILDGPANVGISLLPNRSVERLHWTSSSVSYLRTGAFPSIRVLSLRHRSPFGIGFDLAFPNLQYLQCESYWSDVCCLLSISQLSRMRR